MMPESMKMRNRMLYSKHTCRRGSLLLCTLVCSENQSVYESFYKKAG